MLSLFECNTCSSSVSLEEIKSSDIFNWIFHVSGFSCIRFFKIIHDVFQVWLNFIETFLFDRVSVTITFLLNILLLRNYLFWLILNNCSKSFWISLIILSKIFLAFLWSVPCDWFFHTGVKYVYGFCFFRGI